MFFPKKTFETIVRGGASYSVDLCAFLEQMIPLGGQQRICIHIIIFSRISLPSEISVS